MSHRFKPHMAPEVTQDIFEFVTEPRHRDPILQENIVRIYALSKDEVHVDLLTQHYDEDGNPMDTIIVASTRCRREDFAHMFIG